MANHKSAAKRARQNLKREAHNRTLKSNIRTFERKLRTAISAHNKDEAETLLRTYMSRVTRAAKKGVMDSNAASRKISRLSSHISAL